MFMPGRNIIKEYGAEEYYHVYSRGVAKQIIFLDTQDYGYFLGLFKRYLSSRPQQAKAHGLYPNYAASIDLNAFCLMPNHFHLLVYQYDERAITQLLRSISTSYSMYFNKRYNRLGPVFESRYRASRIDKSNYLEHISRYIHINPVGWQNYEYSSLPYYMIRKYADWIKPGPILDMFEGPRDYLKFLKDYESQKEILDELKWELANEVEE